VASTVLIGDDEVVVNDPSSAPSMRRLSLAEAWAGSGRMLFVRDPDRLVELLRTLAPRFDDARARVWRDLRPLPPRRFEWRWDRGNGGEAKECWIEVDGGVVRRPKQYYDDTGWHTVDDLYIHGPTQPGIPADVRAALVDYLGLDPADAFPRVEHAAIAYRSWSWNQREDGEEGASIGGASVVIGYQYQHDIAWGDHAVERVITRAADVYLNAPAAVEAELRTLLEAAVRV
jgi:hypothetical protein